MKYISSILLLFLVSISIAQKTEKIKKDYKPSAIRIGGNISGLIKNVIDNNFNKIEGQTDIDFHNFFFVVDFGYEKNLFSSGNYNYENKGNYYRIGVQANIQPYNLNRNVFFFGLRYARSQFEDNLNFINFTDKFGNAQFSLSNDNLKAKWFELNTGLKVKIIKQFYFGYTIHFKFIQSFSGNGELIPKNIPGFGKSDKKSTFGFSYYISYNIPFRKKDIPVNPQKVQK